MAFRARIVSEDFEKLVPGLGVRIARSGDERSYHEASASPTLLFQVPDDKSESISR